MNSGKAVARELGRLNERDRQLLTGHFPVYRITTHEALHRARWRESDVDAVKKWTSRMRDQGWIAEASRWTKQAVYFRLTPEAAECLHLPARLGRPLSPTQLERAYGVLSFCLLGDRSHHKLTPEEFRKQFPVLISHNLEDDWYYLDTDYEDERWPKGKRLGYVFVDSDRRLRDVVRRCGEVVGQRQRHNRWYHDIIQRGRFLFAVVTTTERKRDQILGELSDQRKKIPIRVEVRHDLMHPTPERDRDAS